MFEFSDHKQELNKFCIPDITNIIIGYTYGYIEKFDEVFIENCIDNSEYLYYNKNKVTLVHYLFGKKRYDNIKILLKNSKYLRAEHFQNKNNIGETELSRLCLYEMHDTIIQIDGPKAEHFQNKDNKERTELHWLCLNKMHDTIIQIDGLKAEHFQNKNIYGHTELYWLCKNEMHDTIIQIYGLKAKHFQNKDGYGRTELYWLCKNNMHITIKLIGHNFVDGFWELEHCNTDMERQYMKEYILVEK